MKREIDIVLPVYDGFEETVQCIESVMSSRLSGGVHLNVIEDCSPNERLVEWLEDAAIEHGFTLHRNSRNLGFVRSVNIGMRLHPERDVILLNSDTIVANDWIARLAAHVAADPKVATVTPFSNNATICSFPNFCEENPLPPCPVEVIDAAFSAANSGVAIEIPTAVGFCMYIRRDCLNQVGLFDEESFGRGYGEENDFCMRASDLGWRHVIATDVFVAHVGGVSFSREKAERVVAAQDILDKKHPDYHKRVHEFIRADELVKYRLQAALELLRRCDQKVVLLVSHSLGGGVETHVRELEAVFGDEVLFPIIRPSQEKGKFEFSTSPSSKDKILFDLPEECQSLENLCRSIGVGHVYIHHTMGVDPCLFGLAEGLGCGMSFMAHDYYLINANPTLTSEDGRFCENKEERDGKCARRYDIPFGVDAETWREHALNFLKMCDNAFAPSRRAADIFSEYFPEIQFQVLYHPDGWQSKFPDPERRGKRKVLVLGAISKEKGADVLESVALLARERGMDLEFHLLGYAYRPLEGVIEHGPYASDEVGDRIEGIRPDVVWYPALWPETYSYTLSEGLRTGLPIVASDIGAFPERLAGRPLTRLVDWSSSPEEWLEGIERLIDSSATQTEDGRNDWRDIYKDSEGMYALLWQDVRKVRDGEARPISLDCFSLNGSHMNPGWRERLLVVLVKLRHRALPRMMVRYVPASFQRKCKRWLSRRPIHDVIRRS